jgi:hypothetical protein
MERMEEEEEEEKTLNFNIILIKCCSHNSCAISNKIIKLQLLIITMMRSVLFFCRDFVEEGKSATNTRKKKWKLVEELYFFDIYIPKPKIISVLI